jgi:ribosome maturation factor RimP
LTALEERIERLLGPAIEAAGFELVRVRLAGAERKTLQIMAERPDRTMTAEDCALLSRALSPILDAEDPIPGAYRLEVSSPGVDRPLTRRKDFADWRGHDAKIELDRMIHGRRKFSGALAGIEGDSVRLSVEGADRPVLIPFAWIRSARLALTDDLIRASLKAAKDATKGTRKERPDAHGGEPR